MEKYMKNEFKPCEIKISKPIFIWLCKKPPGFIKKLILLRMKRYRILVPEEWQYSDDELVQLLTDAIIPTWFPEKWQADARSIIKAKAEII